MGTKLKTWQIEYVWHKHPDAKANSLDPSNQALFRETDFGSEAFKAGWDAAFYVASVRVQDAMNEAV